MYCLLVDSTMVCVGSQSWWARQCGRTRLPLHLKASHRVWLHWLGRSWVLATSQYCWWLEVAQRLGILAIDALFMLFSIIVIIILAEMLICWC